MLVDATLDKDYNSKVFAPGFQLVALGFGYFGCQIRHLYIFRVEGLYVVGDHHLHLQQEALGLPQLLLSLHVPLELPLTDLRPKKGEGVTSGVLTSVLTGEKLFIIYYFL